MIPSSVWYECSGKILGDVHELVDDSTGFVIRRKLIEMVCKDFNDVMGRVREGFLPDFGEAPNAGVSAACGPGTSHTGDL